MRNLEVRLVDLLVAVEEKIEIDGPRAPLWDALADAPQGLLEGKQRGEELAWGQTRCELDRAVQKARLVDDSDRLRVP